MAPSRPVSILQFGQVFAACPSTNNLHKRATPGKIPIPAGFAYRNVGTLLYSPLVSRITAFTSCPTTAMSYDTIFIIGATGACRASVEGLV